MTVLNSPLPGQRFFAPEVVQTSAMDCGPAALKSILEGFGVPVNYGRLREACQTDVDGTSINTIEDIAVQLGLRAEQVMLPQDHLVLEEAQALPAIVVVRRPSGMTHFLVAWNKVANFIQVMDPATGRRWPTWKSFQNELFIHTFPVGLEDWRLWAGSDGLLAPLRRRMKDLRLDERLVDELITEATTDPGWRSLATLDAATRMTAGLVRARALVEGEEAGQVLQRFYRLNLEGPLPQAAGAMTGSWTAPSQSAEKLVIPANYWSVLPILEDESQARGEAPPSQLLLQGAVLVRILGRQDVREATTTVDQLTTAPSAPFSPDLQAALSEPPYRPERTVWNALREDGLFTPAILILAMFMASLAVMIEALIFQGLLRVGQNFPLVSQRILAMLTMLAFVLAPMILEYPLITSVQRLGRRLEVRLRIAFLEKIPRLGDRYFRSRLASDMTQRAHDLRQLRSLPNLGVGLIRTTFQLILTALGVIWLDPISAPFAILGTIFFVGLSFLTRPLLEEQDLRLRTHTGALSRFYLDALLGLSPVRTHGAERAMRRQHEMQLFEWVVSGRQYQRWATFVQSLGVMAYSGFAILIIFNYISKGGYPNEILLLFYWTLSLPTLGQALADLLQQYPLQRNMILRLLEPLSAPDEEEAWVTDVSAVDQTAELSASVAISIQKVTLQAGGHVILRDINLDIQPGEHIAIVGMSGAGKTSLVGLLLGWHRPSSGHIYIDGLPLDGRRIRDLRQATAWIDPAVQLWNRSLYENLRYGMEYGNSALLNDAIQKADLMSVLERLPEGMKTELGEGGGLVSGGEGQKVRLGRAFYRTGTRLAILDEPFRGLDRENRRRLLEQARQHWQNTTLLCITHDVGETMGFPRVLVIENGQIIEDGSPKELASDQNSRYFALLAAEEKVRKNLWDGVKWRRFLIDAGHLEEVDML